MEQEGEDDLYYDGAYTTSPSPKKSKEEITKENAQRIYNQLIGDDELMHEVNFLLRKNKLDKLKNK